MLRSISWPSRTSIGSDSKDQKAQQSPLEPIKVAAANVGQPSARIWAPGPNVKRPLLTGASAATTPRLNCLSGDVFDAFIFFFFLSSFSFSFSFLTFFSPPPLSLGRFQVECWIFIKVYF